MTSLVTIFSNTQSKQPSVPINSFHFDMAQLVEQLAAGF